MNGPPGSGGHTTMTRIAGQLDAAGHTVVVIPQPGSAPALRRLIDLHAADLVIGTHAYLAGRLFLDAPVPTVIAFGGTDLNEYAHDPAAAATMTTAVGQAAALVAFTPDFVRRAVELWPSARERLHLIPQSVACEPEPHYSFPAELGLGAQDVILLLPAGLRPVKDPLLLMNAVQQWHREDPRIRLVISGIGYDPDFTELVLRRCARAPGVDYVGLLSRPRLHAAMLASAVVLNTSLSECMPNAVLEAMRLGRAVLVRDVPGNTCLVRPEETGLLFGDPAGFRRQAARLIDDPDLRDRLGRQARAYAGRTHAPQHEQQSYDRLVRAVAGVPAAEVPQHAG